MRFKELLTRELTPNDGVSYYLDGTAQGMIKVRMYVYLSRKYSERPENLELVIKDLMNVFREPVEVTQEMVLGFFSHKLVGYN